MSNKSWTIRRFRTAQFVVKLECEYEDEPDLFWADQETLDKINSGEWGCYMFSVHVLHNGCVIGSDYLGGLVYADPADFATEHRGEKLGSYFSDMVRTAIAEARAELAKPRPYIRTAA